MTSNLDRFKKDLDLLIEDGELLEMAIQAEALPSQFDEALRAQMKGKDPKTFRAARRRSLGPIRGGTRKHGHSFVKSFRIA